MDYSAKTRNELIALCKEHGVKGYSGKAKPALIALLGGGESVVNTVVDVPVADAVAVAVAENVIVTQVAPPALRMIDLFAGTGAFTHAFQNTGKVGCVFANDMVEWSKTHPTFPVF